ncbi:MAG: HAD family phosphatase [Candidatus Margulisbacteria bacterium]|jgi:phosphoserine phosphatase|nr:HAD family phosphatase [Candidatus Margulisiibacteriota bacterium]
MLNLKLFIFDVDHTLTDGASIWELLHQECGTWETEGKLFLKQFLAGEIDFDEFSSRDARSWRGKSLAYLQKAQAKIKITPGFPELRQELQQRNITTAIISSTIGQFAAHLAQKYRIDYCFANPLGLQNNILDGTIDLQVKGEAKGTILAALVKKLNLQKNEIAVAGDSRFDLPMFAHAEHSFIIGNEQYKKACRYFVRDFGEVLKILG